MRFLRFVAAVATVVGTAFPVAATTVRFDYNTNADQTRTGILPFDIISGPTNVAAGQYNGTVANVTGYLDLDFSGATPVVVDYSLAATVPHGVATGIALTYPGSGYPVPGPFASITMTPSGAVANTASAVLINLTQSFLFDTRFGPQPANLVYCDPNGATLYPFLMTLTMQVIDGAGLNGGPAFQVRRLQMSCNDQQYGPQVPAYACNGYRENYGFWNMNSAGALRYAMTDVTNGGNTGGMSPVPLPAGLPLMVSGLLALGFLRRRKA